MKRGRILFLIILFIFIAALLIVFKDYFREPTVTLIFPNGGENLYAEDAETIKWTSSGKPSLKVKLEYSVKGADGPYTTIDSDLANSGSYSWMPEKPYFLEDTISDGNETRTLHHSGNSYLRITLTDNGRIVASDISDLAFSILPPILMTDHPNSRPGENGTPIGIPDSYTVSENHEFVIHWVNLDGDAVTPDDIDCKAEEFYSWIHYQEEVESCDDVESYADICDKARTKLIAAIREMCYSYNHEDIILLKDPQYWKWGCIECIEEVDGEYRHKCWNAYCVYEVRFMCFSL